MHFNCIPSQFPHNCFPTLCHFLKCAYIFSFWNLSIPFVIWSGGTLIVEERESRMVTAEDRDFLFSTASKSALKSTQPPIQEAKRPEGEAVPPLVRPHIQPLSNNRCSFTVMFCSGWRRVSGRVRRAGWSIHGTTFRGFSISQLINNFCSAFTLRGDKK